MTVTQIRIELASECDRGNRNARVLTGRDGVGLEGVRVGAAAPRFAWSEGHGVHVSTEKLVDTMLLTSAAPQQDGTVGRLRSMRLGSIAIPSARHRLAQRLRSERLARQLSQEQLAALAGVHRTYVGSIERAERNVSIDSVERLADALGVDISVLLSPLK